MANRKSKHTVENKQNERETDQTVVKFVVVRVSGFDAAQVERSDQLVVKKQQGVRLVNILLCRV